MPSSPRSQRRLPVPLPILVLLAIAVAAALYAALVPEAHAAEHPQPRAGVTAAAVQPPARYAGVPAIAEVYAEVARIPEVVDGIYCYCNCAEHSGHYSLLTCFEDDHGAGCDVCLEQAHLAYTMTGEGKSLEEIRAAIDQRFGA